MVTMSTDTAAGYTSLSANECWALLRGTDIGRLAVVVAGRPEIFPLNFVTDHGTLVFRTGSGTKLAAVSERSLAAFEIDGVDPESATAWSVVVHGRVEPLTSFEPLDTETLPLHPLQGGPKPHFVRVVADSVSGRRFDTVDAAAWPTPSTVRHSHGWD